MRNELRLMQRVNSGHMIPMHDQASSNFALWRHVEFHSVSKSEDEIGECVECHISGTAEELSNIRLALANALGQIGFLDLLLFH